MCTNIGHGHPTVVEAIKRQAETLAYANPFMATEPRARLGQKLAEICPGDIDTEFLRLRPVVPGEADRVQMLTPSDVARTVQFVLDSPPHVVVNELVVTPTKRDRG